MKTLLTFFGIMILYMALLTFQSDGTHVTMLRAETDRISREAAAGAIQYFDAWAYAQGYMVVDETASEQFADDFIRRQLVLSGKMAGGETEWEIEIKGPESAEENPQPSSVTVKLIYKGQDFFRLPFLEKKEIASLSKYEVAGR